MDERVQSVRECAIRVRNDCHVQTALYEGVGLLGVLALLDALTNWAPAVRLLYLAPLWVTVRRESHDAPKFVLALTVVVAAGLDVVAGRSVGFLGFSLSVMLYAVVLFGLLRQILSVEVGLEAYAKMARRDQLTGLYNRFALQEYGADAVARAEAKGMPLSVIVFDCDRFKDLNDKHGHAYGDKILSLLGRTLKRTFRGAGFVARTGGDEFVAVLPNRHLDEAMSFAELASKAFAEETVFEPEVALSYGVARFPVHGYTMDELIQAADHRMYLAKSDKIKRDMPA